MSSSRFDEVSCDEHRRDLEKHADNILGSHNGVLRNHISSSAKLSRGVKEEDIGE